MTFDEGYGERDPREDEIEARTVTRIYGVLRRVQAGSPNPVVRRAICDLIAAIDEEISREV